MRCTFAYTRIFLISYLLLIIITVGISWTKSANDEEFQETSGEPLKHLAKRSTFNEYRPYDLLAKTGDFKSSKLRYHFTSTKSSYHDGSKSKQFTTQVQGVEQGDTHYWYKTDPEQIQANNDQSYYSIIYLGCFSTWENQRSRLYTDDKYKYDDSLTHITCATICLRLNEKYQISFLKGSVCRCTTTYEFDSAPATKPCDISCPFKDYDPSVPQSQPPQNPCGGNEAYSVYCMSGPNDCNEVRTRIKQKWKQNGMISKHTENAIQISRSRIVLEQSCTVCINQNPENSCSRMYFHPDFDYFPILTPMKCVEYCSNPVNFIATTHEPRVREPTTYALMLGWNDAGKDLPICKCVDGDKRAFFKPALDPTECDMPCSGMLNATCGGVEKGSKLFATVYCVDDLINGKCQKAGVQTTTTPTTSIPEKDPCIDEDRECDEESTTPDPTDDNSTGITNSSATPTESTSDTTMETTTTPPSPSTTIRTTFTTPETTTTTKSPSTTPEITPTAQLNTTTTTTEIPTTSRSSAVTTPDLPCSSYCFAIDRYNYRWKVCAGSEGIADCSRLIKNSTGVAFWECYSSGRFASPQPNVSNCSSTWLEEQHKEVENIKDIVAADNYIVQLSEACKNSAYPDSNSKYFGHEIRNITSLIDLTLSKARGFSSSFPKFESVVEKAVDLNVFLIQYHEPWKDLLSDKKSSVSTSLIENTEESLFHLTEVVKDQTYKRIFSLDTIHLSQLLILAETFHKSGNKMNGSYEFPPLNVWDKQDSFIRLPVGWENFVPQDKVEIAAMSIDSQYISYVMPGQYESLRSASNVDASSQKLINGKLISLSLTSSQDAFSFKSLLNGQNTMDQPILSFAGKGVEITFRHDIEAWGDEVLNVPRKLHDGEKPKAVLGSSQCVYWDTKSHIWSSKGCHIVTSNRYETVCECNHLTSFAVLMDTHRYVGKDLALELLTLILCPLSEVALVLSIIILSSVNGLQKIRASITKNLSFCLLLGNAMVLLVLDRNYFHMSEGMCTGAAIVTHYIFLAAFMWMVIEGVQLYRMVVHVFDSGRSYIKHFGVFAYGSPLIVVAITATTGYLKGDKPYGGDVYCWLEGSYIWSFLGPVAIVTMINLIILFIALKTAYQLQQNKKLSPTFLTGRIRSYKTWFKGCVSLTVILGLTWVVGFFTLMNAPSGIIAAYLFTLLNASQGIFIFVFHCVLNDKVRSFTKRNLSVYLPSWLTSSSDSSGHEGNDGSVNGKRPLASVKTRGTTEHENTKSKSQRTSIPPNAKNMPYIISKAKLRREMSVDKVEMPKDPHIKISEARNYHVSPEPVERSESVGTISSVDSIPNSTISDNEQISSDTSYSALISRARLKM